MTLDMTPDASTILIAYDGSPNADDALDDLRRAGLPLQNTSAHVLSVADVWSPPVMPEIDLTLLESSPRVAAMVAMRHHAQDHAQKVLAETERRAARGAARVREIFPTWQTTSAAIADSPAWGVLSVIDQMQPTLTVVGEGGRTAENFIFGSVAQKIVTKARGSVRVGRRRSPLKTASTPAQIVIGFDGSPDAHEAVKIVSQRAWPAGTGVLLLTCLDPRLSSDVAPLLPFLARWVEEDDSDGDEFAWVHRMIECAATALEISGFQVEREIHDGEPKRLLLEAAREREADCVFIGAKGLVGSSGLRGLERFFLGSTAAVIAGRAPCSVEVIRSAQTLQEMHAT